MSSGSEPGDSDHDVVIIDSSLAPSPTDRKRFQTATVTFNCVPARLDSCVKTRTQLPFDVSVDGVLLRVYVDTHFYGFTPLNDGVGGGGYSVE